MLARIVRYSLLMVLVTLGTANADRWSNKFVEFELPPQWKCSLEGAEWVCQSTDKLKKRDAIIILAAKLKGDQDSLDQYELYLSKPKRYKSVKGRPVKSEPKYTKQIQIKKHPWVSSLHLESEIPGFYTRYLATVKKDIAVLVTYSINKDKYTRYRPTFEAMAKTLKVFRKGFGINAQSKNQNLFDSITIPDQITDIAVLQPEQPIVNPGGGTGAGAAASETSGNDLFLLIGGIALVAFILFRRRRG